MVLRKKRYDYIDIAKGVCILTIVLFHIDFSYWSDNIIGVYLSRFTSFFKVTLFFCLSGLTLKEEKLFKTREFIINKIRKLYLKVVIIGIVFVLLHNLFIIIGFYTNGEMYSGKLMFHYSPVDVIKECFFSLLLANREVMIGPLWFGNVLFIALMIEAIISAFTKKTKFSHGREIRLAISFFLMVVGWILSECLSINIPRFNNSLSALFLIDFTQYLTEVKKVTFDNYKVFIIAVVICLLSPLAGSFSMNKNSIINPAFFVIITFSFMYSIMFLTKKIEKLPLNVLKTIGKYSFEIMAYQFLSFKIASLIILEDTGLLVPHAENAFMLLYYLLFGISLPVLIGVVIGKIKSIKRKKINETD